MLGLSITEGETNGEVGQKDKYYITVQVNYSKGLRFNSV